MILLLLRFLGQRVDEVFYEDSEQSMSEKDKNNIRAIW